VFEGGPARRSCPRTTRLPGVVAVVTADDLGDVGRIPTRLGHEVGNAACLQRPLARDKFRSWFGHGGHMSFNAARIALDAGVMPFTIGGDIHGYTIRRRDESRVWGAGALEASRAS
jgi:hypothetical protein